MALTFFAPPDRFEADLIQLCAATINDANLSAVLESHPTPTLLLTSTRQIVFANRAFRSLDTCLGKEYLGLRIGEALQCVQLLAAPSGCGTGKACRNCGAARAIVDS